MPDSGPMSAAFTELMVSGSISPFATRSSIEATTPPTNGAKYIVMLKNSRWRVSAAA